MGILKYQGTVLPVVGIDFLKFRQRLSLRQFSLLLIKIVLHVNDDPIHLLRRQTGAGFYSLLLQKCHGPLKGRVHRPVLAHILHLIPRYAAK